MSIPPPVEKRDEEKGSWFFLASSETEGWHKNCCEPSKLGRLLRGKNLTGRILEVADPGSKGRRGIDCHGKNKS